MERETNSLIGGCSLSCSFIISFLSIGPITNGLYYDPICFALTASRVQTRSLHFAPNRFWLKSVYLLAEVDVID